MLEKNRMKTLRLIIAAIVVAPLAALAQNQNVTQAIATKRVNSDIVIPSGKSFTVENGGSITINSGATTSGILSSASLAGLATGIATITTGTGALGTFSTSSGLAAVVSDETGSGALVFGTSPTLVTPSLGVATATSINKLAITAPATAATLTIADGKTFTASNTLAFTGTDSTSFAFPSTSGTVATLAATQTLTGKTLTSPVLTTPAVSGAITLPDGVEQVFNPDATNAGINVGSIAGDPSTPNNGALWYDSTAGELTARINGANVALGAGGGGSGLFVGRSAKTGAYTVVAGDKGYFIDCTSGTFSISFTAAATLTAGFHVAVYNSGSGTITLDPNGSETIRDPASSATTKTLTQGQGMILVCDGTGFLAAATASAGSSAPADATYITQTSNGTLSAEQALSSLSTGIMRVETSTGVVTSLTNSTGIFNNISDESGSGSLVGNLNPTISSIVFSNTTPSIAANSASVGFPGPLVLTAAGSQPISFMSQAGATDDATNRNYKPDVNFLSTGARAYLFAQSTSNQNTGFAAYSGNTGGFQVLYEGAVSSGTISTPTAAGSGRSSTFQLVAHYGSGWANTAALTLETTQTQSSGARGAKIEGETVADGTSTVVTTFRAQAGAAAGDFQVVPTTTSTSTTTGALTVAGGAGIAGPLYTQQPVVVRTTALSVAANQTRALFTNEGATAQVVFTLPTAAANYKYTFVVQDTDGIRVTAASGDTIRIAGTATAAAGYVENATIGSTLTLVAINATEWIATSVNGTWTFGP
jgi:hypothetical protein